MSIPTIDLRGFGDGSSAQDKATAAQLLAAYRDVGFAYLMHPIPQTHVDAAFQHARDFFALPDDVKSQVLRPRNGRDARGWTPPGGGIITQDVFDPEALTQAKAASSGAYEFYILGKTNHPYLPNRLPAALPTFGPDLLAFVDECTTFYRTILRAFATGLGTIPPGWFEQFHTTGTEHLYLNHYLGGPLPPGGKPRLNAHTDYGYLVCLFQDDVGGLQVQDPASGEFVPVPPRPGTLVANVGDMLHRWSNGVLRSTVHRVVPPTRQGANGLVLPERFSLPFAGSPDPDTLIDCIPGCWSADNPKRFEPIVGQEWIEMRQGTQYA